MLPVYPAAKANTVDLAAASSALGKFPLYSIPTSPKLQELRAKHETLRAMDNDPNLQLHRNCVGSLA